MNTQKCTLPLPCYNSGYSSCEKCGNNTDYSHFNGNRLVFMCKNCTVFVLDNKHYYRRLNSEGKIIYSHNRDDMSESDNEIPELMEILIDLQPDACPFTSDVITQIKKDSKHNRGIL